MQNLGLNPNVTTRDPSDPQGLANLVWDKLFPLMTTDEMNNLGDHGGVIYNRLNFSDYTGYEPVNRPIPFLMKDVDRWQPNVVQLEKNSSSPGNRMYPRVQNFIQPQSKNVQSTLIDPRWIDRNIHFRAPDDTYAISPRKYREKTNQVIKASAELTDEDKMIAEFFDMKLVSLGAIGGFALAKYFPPNSTDIAIPFEFLLNNLIWSAVTISWKAKFELDHVRPFSSIRFINLKPRSNPPAYYNITAWAGPFEGTQTYPANQWDSYLTTDAHPEYPSGTACVCSAWASGANLFFGTNVVNYTTTFPAGSSSIEPGLTPRNPVNVLIPTFLEEKGQPYTSSVEAFCGESRNLGGVHFLSSIAASKSVCPALGPPSYKNLKKLLAGDVSWKWWPH